jgi:hypothetical protein
MMRVTVSVPVPGGNPIMMVTGLSGYAAKMDIELVNRKASAHNFIKSFGFTRSPNALIILKNNELNSSSITY